MGVIWAIAKTTYRESLRQRVLLVVLLMGLMLIGVSFAFSYLSTGEEFRFVVDFGLVGITMIGLGLAVILGGFMIPTEIDRRVIFTVLSKPVSRLQYLLGKFVGAALVILVLDLLMGVAFVVAYCTKHPLGWGGFQGTLITALACIYLQTLILLAAALTLSTFATPTFCLIATGFFYIIGAVNTHVKFLSERSDGTLQRVVFGILSKLFPNFTNFDMRQALLLYEPLNLWPDVGRDVLLYTVAYCAMLLAIAWIMFNEREF